MMSPFSRIFSPAKTPRRRGFLGVLDPLPFSASLRLCARLFRVFLIGAALALPVTLSAEETPSVWPMPSSLPSVPPGVNIATYPFPKVDWLLRVQTNIKKARAGAASIRLVFDGDSITDWWTARAKDLWNERYGKLNSIDFGIAGDGTQQLLWRLSQGQVDGLHPKLVVLMIGTNNSGGQTAEQVAEGIAAIVTEYRKRCPDAVILLQAIFPRGQLATDPFRAKIGAINKIISKLADGEKVLYLDFSDKFLERDGALSPEIMPDFLHPSPKGYQIWADAIQPVIDKYFPGQSPDNP